MTAFVSHLRYHGHGSTMSVQARVLSVRPHQEGYAVTLGPGPDYYWLVSQYPVREGQLLDVEADGRTKQLSGGKATLTVLSGGKMRVVREPFDRRAVPQRWLDRVRGATSLRLLPHQSEGAGWLAERLANGASGMLADSPGLGKTLQVIAALAATGSWPAIIVAPANLKRQWAQELNWALPKLPTMVITSEQGPLQKAGAYVINYALLKARELALRKIGARAIVFDEAHWLKEPRPRRPGHRAAVATRIALGIGRVVMLTGTPIVNRPEELWRLLYLLEPKQWSDYTTFRANFCQPLEEQKNDAKVTTMSYRDPVARLHCRIGHLFLRRRKRQVMQALLPKKRRSVLVELGPEDRSSYDRAEADVIAWLESLGDDRGKKKNEVLLRLTALRRIAAIGKMRRGFGTYLAGWFRVYRDRPLVVFGYHRVVVRAAFSIARRLGLQTVGIQATDSFHRRAKALAAFNSGSAQVFVAPIRCAGLGLNLQHRCSDALYLERLWTPAEMEQSEDRLHRLGQKRQVTITYLDAKATIDERLATVLAAKQRLIDSVLDDEPSKAEQASESLDEVLASFGLSHGCLPQQ